MTALVAAALGFLVCVLVPSLLHAQDPSDLAAYRALTQTPFGALGTAIAPSIVGVPPHRVGLEFRYGIRSLDDEEYVHNFGLAATLPVRRAAVGLVAGYSWPDCQGDCDGHFMAAASWSDRLVGVPLGGPPGGAQLNVGLDLTAGFGAPPDATLWSGAASVPFTLVPRQQGLRFFPYVSPGFGAGLVHSDGDGTEAGLRATFATGVLMLAAGDRLGINAGVQRVFLRGGNWLASFAIAWRTGR